MLSKYFDHIFCINLPRRTDRRKEAEDELKKFNIKNVEFVDGVDGLQLNIKRMRSKDGLLVSRGDIGCVLSHLKVVQLAKERNLKNYLVFEDDVEFADNFNTVFPTYIQQVPDNWDQVYFGGNHDGGYQMLNLNIAKIFRTFTTHAFAVKNTIYDDMIKVLARQHDKVDISISSLHKDFNCFVFRPHLAFQRAGYSDILEKHDNYIHLRK